MSAIGAHRLLVPLMRLFLPAPYSTEKEKNPLLFGEKLLSAQSTPTQCVVNLGENVNALKSSILEKVPWKNLRRCNQREVRCPCGRQHSQKVSKTEGTAADLFGRIFSANSRKSWFESQTNTVKTPVSRYEPVCGTPAAWVASVHLQRRETQCRGVFGPLLRGTVCPLEISGATQKNAGRLGHRPVSR